ncbi:MAG: deaminase [Fuerstiella sp.]
MNGNKLGLGNRILGTVQGLGALGGMGLAAGSLDDLGDAFASARKFRQVSNKAGKLDGPVDNLHALAKNAPARSAWDTIDRFGSGKRGMQELGDVIPVRGDGLGTVAYVEVGGRKVFGVNSTALVNDADKALGRMWRDRLGFNAGQAQALFHGEAHSLMRAYQKTGVNLPAEMSLYVDRLTCGPCQGSLPTLVKEMGIRKLTIRTKDGHIGDIIDGIWQGWR